MRRTVLPAVLAAACFGLCVAAGLRPLYAWLAGVNAATFLCYGLDKWRATQGRSRVPEVWLHLLALAGGTPGALLAQGLFRHKTRKRAFRRVFFVIAFAQAGLLALLAATRL